MSIFSVVARHEDGTERILKLVARPDTVLDSSFLELKNVRLREYDALRKLCAAGRAPKVESYFTFDQDQFWVVPIDPAPGRSLRADRVLGIPKGDRIVAVLKDSLAALHEIHELGIIHRGLTPDRIFVQDEHVIFTDFFAARIEGKESIATSLRNLVDLDPFIAPEMRLDPPRTSRATDLYGLAASLWYWISGREPEEAMPNLSVLRPDLPASCQSYLDETLRRCMAADPNAREDQLV